MSIKKNLMAIAITALAGGSVFAQVGVNSQVAGGAASYSVANGNSYSTHSASAQATNSSSATGAATTPTTFLGVVTGPYYQAGATGTTSTTGSTRTDASGLGAGMSSAGASQAGTASSNQAANSVWQWRQRGQRSHSKSFAGRHAIGRRCRQHGGGIERNDCSGQQHHDCQHCSAYVGNQLCHRFIRRCSNGYSSQLPFPSDSTVW